MRAKVERILELDGERTYRVLEQDGNPVDCWLPGREAPEPQPLDHGGFDFEGDARAFGLGVDRERALHGLIDESVEDIDRERAHLDTWREPQQPMRPTTAADPFEALLPATIADAPLDLAGLLEAVDKPPAPVIEYRRSRVA